jgi:hypothetical protein
MFGHGIQLHQLSVQLRHLNQSTPQRAACVAVSCRKNSFHRVVQIFIHSNLAGEQRQKSGAVPSKVDL